MKVEDVIVFMSIVGVNNRFVIMSTVRPPGSKPAQYFEEKKKG